MVLSQKYCFRPCLILLRNVHSAAESSHYKTLGLSPSASKAEIKAAYYELSKKHHPDRNHGSEESARIFRNVKAAYEVLGNEQKRIQYDKDRIFKNVKKSANFYYTYDNSDYKDEAERIHYRSRVRPPFRKYSFGKITYYDFDAWYDNHYGKRSENEFFFKNPRQFRQSTEMSKKEVQFKVKIRLIFQFMLYSMIFLSTLSVIGFKKKL